MLRWLAKRYGWEPQGTEPPDEWGEWSGSEKPWTGEYAGNSGQIVTASDAQRWAAALEIALNDPNFANVIETEQRRTRHQFEAASTPLVSFTSEVVPPDVYRLMLQAFIGFCRRGAFRIY